MKTEFTIGKLPSEATEPQHYHRQSISKILQEKEADTTQVLQSKKDHVYAVSDTDGNIIEHYRYTAFGELEIYSPQTQNKLAGSAIANPVLWDIRRYDELTQLYCYLFRHYKGDIGRWLGRDPIEEKDGVNLYRFCYTLPFDLWDRYGLWFLDLPCAVNKDAGHRDGKFSGVGVINAAGSNDDLFDDLDDQIYEATVLFMKDYSIHF